MFKQKLRISTDNDIFRGSQPKDDDDVIADAEYSPEMGNRYLKIFFVRFVDEFN